MSYQNHLRANFSQKMIRIESFFSLKYIQKNNSDRKQTAYKGLLKK